jgi:hypothetical protein
VADYSFDTTGFKSLPAYTGIPFDAKPYNYWLTWESRAKRLSSEMGFIAIKVYQPSGSDLFNCHLFHTDVLAVLNMKD